MGFSLVTQGALRAALPDARWRPLIATFGYSVGLLIVVLGRRSVRVLAHVARLWAIVLAANLAGAFIFAWVAANTAVFRPELRQAFSEIGREALSGSFFTVLLRAILPAG